VQFVIELSGWIDATCSCNPVGDVAGRSGSMLYLGRGIVSGFAPASLLVLVVAMLPGACLRWLDRPSCGVRGFDSPGRGCDSWSGCIKYNILIVVLMACLMHWFVSEESSLGAWPSGGILYLRVLVDLSLYNLLSILQSYLFIYLFSFIFYFGSTSVTVNLVLQFHCCELFMCCALCGICC